PLEQALLARHVDAKQRTAVMARYSLVGTLAGAFGALAAALPGWLASATGLPELHAMQLMFVAYGLVAGASAVVYRGLPHVAPMEDGTARSALGPSKRRVYLLAGLFSIDAFGGGLVVQSLVALWLFQRYGLSVVLAGSIFFWTGV